MFGCRVCSTWFSTNKLFGNRNNSQFLQGFQMARQVSVCQFEQLLQGIEIQCVVHHECRHDSKPDAAFKYFLNV